MLVCRAEVTESIPGLAGVRVLQKANFKPCFDSRCYASVYTRIFLLTLSRHTFYFFSLGDKHLGYQDFSLCRQNYTQ